MNFKNLVIENFDLNKNLKLKIENCFRKSNINGIIKNTPINRVREAKKAKTPDST